MASVDPVFLISPTTQKYAWGKVGTSSKVAQLASTGLHGFALDESSPYAELWMGTHIKSPSGLPDTNETLRDVLAKHPELLGGVSSAFDTTNGNLPFLFKVLSINHALSIQIHPDKPTAEKLHREQPELYADPNHKPELALALTPFHALCGFLPISDIRAYLSAVPELSSLIPSNVAMDFRTATLSQEKAALRALFSAVMTASADRLKTELDKLITRYNKGPLSQVENRIRDLVLTVHSQFPGDVGVFCVFFLNYVILQPGEAIFLGAGEPHAYVFGDIIECMANSDNVIRAGFTPKHKDVPNLIAGLTYNTSGADKHMIVPQPFGHSTHTTIYQPPIRDFTVLKVTIPAHATAHHGNINGPSIAIVTEGSGSVDQQNANQPLPLVAGTAIFIGANAEITFTAGDQEMVVYRAYAV